jgi:hypothetical protein
MVSVAYFYCYAERYYAKRHYFERHYAECCFAKCRYAECHGACSTTLVENNQVFPPNLFLNVSA